MKKQFLNKKVNVLLLSKIHGLGLRFDIKPVSLGYYLNYLSPNNLAVRADDKKITEFLTSIKLKEQEKVFHLKEVISNIENQPLLFERIANKKGVLFNSIAFSDYSDYLQEHYGLNVRKSDLKLPRISTHGVFKLNVTVGNSLSTDMLVSVAGSIEDSKSLLKDYNSKGVEGERK